MTQRDVQDIASIHKEGELIKLIQLLSHRTGNLLNVSSVSNDLAMDRKTAEKYIAILERLFLVRRLQAWHRNHAKRLVGAPKIHVIDSGLAAMLNHLSVGDWKSHSSEFGGLLESFVVQQLMCQAGWVDADLTFSHYRDKEKVEVELVIEKGRKVWGVEVKRSSSLRNEDGVGLAKLAAQAGQMFQGGILLYCGASCLPLKVENCFAVPLDRLW